MFNTEAKHSSFGEIGLNAMECLSGVLIFTWLANICRQGYHEFERIHDQW